MIRSLTITIAFAILGSTPASAGEGTKRPTADEVRRWVDARGPCKVVQALELPEGGERAGKADKPDKPDKRPPDRQKAGPRERDGQVQPDARTLEAARVACGRGPADLTADDKRAIDAAISEMPGFGAREEAAPAASAAGVDWQTNLLNGLTAFLLERARAETVEGFLLTIKEDYCGCSDDPRGAQVTKDWRELVAIEDRIRSGVASDGDRSRRRQLLEDKVLVVRILFPSTCTYLQTWSFGTGTGPFGGGWQGALVDDLEHFLEHYFDYREWPNDRAQAIEEAVRILYEKLRAVQRGQHPLEALRGLATELGPKVGTPPTCDSDLGRVRAMLYDLGVLAAAGYRAGTPPTWRPLDREELRAVLGQLACVPIDQPERLLRINDLGRDVVQRVEELRTLRADGQKKDPEVAVAVLGVFQSFLGLVAELRGDPQMTTLVASFVRLSSLVVDARSAAAAANYGLFTVKVSSFVVEVDAAVGAEGRKLPDSVIRLARLASDLGSAKSADEIKSALDANAAPLGTFRAKRGKGHRLTSVTGFVGAAGGYEWLPRSGRADGSESRGSGTLGLFVPVGVDVSWGVGTSKSWSVFVSLIDLGALADFRLREDDVAQTPNIGFKQVISPGLFVTHGLGRKLPFVIGVGAQVSPELRRISAGTVEARDETSIRAAIFFGVDVTLFRF